jgi:hypothetical protein
LKAAARIARLPETVLLAVPDVVLTLDAVAEGSPPVLQT